MSQSKARVTKGQQAGLVARRWSFGGVVLDERLLELRMDGDLVKIEHKPLGVLVHLLHHAGEVVTKDELVEAVWPGRVVSDTVLAKAIGKLRDALHDQSQELIKTVHGYGYRLTGEVQVATERAKSEALFDFKPGDRPPGRPQWSLVRRLGTGGHGEAWLALHDKTREQRVFKFAIDRTSLASLKREITLFRFLNDSLGERARIVPIREWNLEQPPCFLECEFAPAGSLAEWAERSGGLTAIPLAVRLDMAAQLAETLAAIHSVGVLHKDLKPSNVLVQMSASGVPQVLLADFGSGGVMDPKRLEALGITRLGFTKTIAALGASSGGTPLYLAPELLAGQPPTVKADIFALGVMLYQLVIGEFRKAMSPGWERDVSDELVRECIAEAAQGDAAHRLGDASVLAQRLRALDDEREQRRQQRAAQAKAEELERLVAAAKASQAVADFLSKDMFAVVSSRPLRDLTVRELLEAASAQVAGRFQDMPLAAARIHAALGGAFWTMECMEDSGKHLDAALSLFEQLGLGGSEAAAAVASQLMPVDVVRGKQRANLNRYERVLAQGTDALGPGHPQILGLKQQIAVMHFGVGDWRRSAEELRQVVDAMRASGTAAAPAGMAAIQLGRILTLLGEFASAGKVLQEARTWLLAVFGPAHVTIAHVGAFQGQLLVALERFDEAEAEISRAAKLLRPWVSEEATVQLVSLDYLRGQLRLRQGRTDDAIDILERVVKSTETLAWMQQSGFIGEIQCWLALAYLAAGRLDVAATAARAALAVSEASGGLAHPQAHMARIALAEIECQRGADAAREVLAALDAAALKRLGEDHPLVGEWRRVEGLIATREGRPDLAQASFSEALRIFEGRFGRDHSFTARARADLAQAQKSAAGR